MFGVGTPAIAIDRDGVVTMLASGEPRYAAPQYVEGRLSAAQLRELLEKAASLDLLSEPPTYHALGDTNVAPTPNESGVYPWLQYNGVEFVTQGQTYVHLAEQLLHPNQETDENRRRLAEFLLPFHDNAFASAESLELSPYSPKEWSMRAKELMPVPEEASLHPFPWTASTQPLGEMGSWVDIDGPALSSALSTVYTSMSHDESTGGASGYYCYTSVAPVAPTTNGGSITSPTVVAYGIEVSPFPAAVMRLTGFPAGEKWVVDDLPPIYPSPPCVIRVDS